MPRNFPQRYRRIITGPFAGDAPPAGVLTFNDPVAQTGLVFRMSKSRVDHPQSPPTERLQGFFVSSVAGLTCDLQLWIASFDQSSGTSVWTRVGDPFLAAIQGRDWESAGQIEDADAFVQVTPSVALLAGQTITLQMEEVD